MSRGNDTRGAAVSSAADDAERHETAERHEAEVAVPAIEALSVRAAGENFPVALRVLPRIYRHRLMAVYRFARLVDDIGDELATPGAPTACKLVSGEGDRLRALGAVEQDVGRAFTAGLTPRLPVVREIGFVAAECAIPAEPFLRLIQANRQDQTVSRYATFKDLLGYCELSANPVGRIVLHIFGAATPERQRLADRVCSALQLAEHWQDVAEDFARGRVYLPQEDMAAFGCTERDLAPPASPAHSASPADSVHQGTSAFSLGTLTVTGRSTPPRVRELMRFETERARRLLDEGAALTGTLSGWARLAVAGYVAGGRATLAAIAEAGAAGSARSAEDTPAGPASQPGRSAGSAGPASFDVLGVTPRPGRARTAGGLIRAYLTGR